MLAVDDMYQNLAPIVKDKHWAQRHFSIPYTLSTAAENLEPAFKGSTFHMRLTNIYLYIIYISVPLAAASGSRQIKTTAKNVSRICRMSAEDLEIHQPADTPVRKQYSPLKGSLGDGLDSFLQRGKGILRGGSLPSLMDISSHPNEEEETDVSPEGNISVTNHKEQKKTLIKVAVEHNS